MQIKGIREELYVKLEDRVPTKILNLKNKQRSWNYGYSEDYDMVVISKTGQIGDIYEIDNLVVALPKAPDTIKSFDSKENQVWKREENPQPLRKITKMMAWNSKPLAFKQKWISYIDEEFRRRDEGYWFLNNGEKTYITGSHYMYLQWSKIDVGYPDYRESNRIFYIFWEACKADHRCYGICYVKNRRSGFSFMASAETVNIATQAKNALCGILSKTGSDAKGMFTEKVVPINSSYPFFFKPLQDGMDKPKTEISYRVPAVKLTKRSLIAKDDDDEEEQLEGLETYINWLPTADNSYDSKKLRLLVHDESGKWEAPNNIQTNWGKTKTTLRVGKKIVGKCMMGSTVNALADGGSNFKKIYEDSDVTKRSKNGQTKSGLYSLFIPMEFNFEGFIDKYGQAVLRAPKGKVYDKDGDLITEGAIDFWENELEALKDDPDKLNEHYRQFPRTEAHAFRDESKKSLFNLTKIYDQIDFNDTLIMSRHVTRGNFAWTDGVRFTTVEWHPDPNGRFLTSWLPEEGLRNRWEERNGVKYPLNEFIGAFGCDSYDISGTVGGGGSKGALHGMTKMNMANAPSNEFFLEYIARPQMAEIFFEDVLMALVFYGMPVLAENTKPRLLYHLKNNGYRGFSMNRPDKSFNKLSQTEREIGGTPNSSMDLLQSHASAIESYIDKHVGYDLTGRYRDEGVCGTMPFNKTLLDWSKFDISKRTFFDASISSGLAIMANQKNLYKPVYKQPEININFATYDNTGTDSSLNI